MVSGSSSKIKVLPGTVTARYWSMMKLLKVNRTKTCENKCSFEATFPWKQQTPLFYFCIFSWRVVIKFMLYDKTITMAKKTSINLWWILAYGFRRNLALNASFLCSHLEPSPQQQAHAWKSSKTGDVTAQWQHWQKGEGCEYSQGQDCKEEWETSEKIKVSIENWQRSMGIYLFQWLWFQKTDRYESEQFARVMNLPRTGLRRWLPRKEWWYNEEAENGQLIFHNVTQTTLECILFCNCCSCKTRSSICFS